MKPYPGARQSRDPLATIWPRKALFRKGEQEMVKQIQVDMVSLSSYALKWTNLHLLLLAREHP